MLTPSELERNVSQLIDKYNNRHALFRYHALSMNQHHANEVLKIQLRKIEANNGSSEDKIKLMCQAIEKAINTEDFFLPIKNQLQMLAAEMRVEKEISNPKPSRR